MVFDITTIILLVLLIFFAMISIALFILFIICLRTFKKFLNKSQLDSNELSNKIDKLLREQINKEELFNKFFETTKNIDNDKISDEDNEINAIENNLDESKTNVKYDDLEDLNSDDDDDDEDINNDEKDKKHNKDDDEEDDEDDDEEEILFVKKDYKSLKDSIFKNKKEFNDDELERSKLFIQEILNDKNKDSFTFIDKVNNDKVNNNTNIQSKSDVFNLLNDQINIFDNLNNNDSTDSVDIKISSNKIDKNALEKESNFLNEAFLRSKENSKDFQLKKISSHLLKEKKALQNAEEDVK